MKWSVILSYIILMFRNEIQNKSTQHKEIQEIKIL